MKSNHLLDLLRSALLCRGVNGPHCLPMQNRQMHTVRISEQCGVMIDVASGPREAAKWDSVQENKTEMSFLPAIKHSGGRGGGHRDGVNPEPLCRKNLYPRWVNTIEEIVLLLQEVMWSLLQRQDGHRREFISHGPSPKFKNLLKGNTVLPPFLPPPKSVTTEKAETCIGY